MLRRIKKRFNVQITSPNQSVNKTFELDKTIVSVCGALVTSDKDDLLYYRGTQKLEINNQEYFPEDYESKLLMSGINSDVNKRFYDLQNANPGNGTVKISYTDADDGRTTFEPYRVSLYLDCDVEDCI